MAELLISQASRVLQRLVPLPVVLVVHQALLSMGMVQEHLLLLQYQLLADVFLVCSSALTPGKPGVFYLSFFSQTPRVQLAYLAHLNILSIGI